MPKAAIIGGGVIGGGWAARFLLNGWDVVVHDPAPTAESAMAQVLDNARAALPALSDVPMPNAGKLTFVASVAEAVRGADFIQESTPERLNLKHRVLSEIQQVAPETPIGSSTSGYKPSELQHGARNPATILVAHPFNPVYLLPLVEIVPSPANDPAIVANVSELLRGLGMFPLHVRKEIDAHIADRFLEAVWREALWLVKDGVATTEEIDEAIRMGFGLRWAQMGLFETFRIAGGEAGMRHFLAQFGPCLKSPWTRLTDVPEFNDALVDLIAGQSDAQSGAHSIRDLERIRDANLVGFLRALKLRDWGAGRVLNAQDAARRGRAGDGPLWHGTVLPGWTDSAGAFAPIHCLTIATETAAAFLRLHGIDPALTPTGCETRMLGTARRGDPLTASAERGNDAPLTLRVTIASRDRPLAVITLHLTPGSQ
ncbi:MAG: carnitine 3-dehydrogenase [Rhodobacteraceae bacterium]|nr:carnitine 3-dehydrogenase [Paracoccaceae bacterium]